MKVDRPERDTITIFLDDTLEPILETSGIELPEPGQFGMGFNSGTGSFDNVTIDYPTIPNTSPVPEPYTIHLLGSGLSSLLGIRRKFKKR